MAKTINITDLLSNDKPVIQIGEKEYPVDNSVESVMRFEELAGASSSKDVLSAIEGALGAKAYKEIGINKMALPNLKVLMTAIMAANQDLSYEEAVARFQQSEKGRNVVRPK